MKKQKSLQVLALAGVAVVALATGCSSTGYSENGTSDKSAAFRNVSASGWSPITDATQMNKLMLDSAQQWNQVWYQTYETRVPVAEPAGVSVATSDLPQFSEDLQPGDAFVEAAGAGPGEVKRVILYTPFQ